VKGKGEATASGFQQKLGPDDRKGRGACKRSIKSHPLGSKLQGHSPEKKHHAIKIKPVNQSEKCIQKRRKGKTHRLRTHVGGDTRCAAEVGPEGNSKGSRRKRAGRNEKRQTRITQKRNKKT